MFERLGQLAVAVEVEQGLPSLRLVENVCGSHGEPEQLQHRRLEEEEGLVGQGLAYLRLVERVCGSHGEPEPKLPQQLHRHLVVEEGLQCPPPSPDLRRDQPAEKRLDSVEHAHELLAGQEGLEADRCRQRQRVRDPAWAY